MGIRRSGLMGLLAGTMLMTAACATTDSEAPVSGGSAAATGAADSLQTCLARIPSDATAGQRAVAEETCKRDQAVRNAVVGVGTAATTSAAAAGHADDSLQACLARIPSDASAGQRMVAEQSCQRDEAARRAAPGR
jgi:hypothetical protein